MKSYKRALRRHQKHVKFLKRMKTWTQGTYNFDPVRRVEWQSDILKGKASTFLRSTGKPCSCYLCSGEGKFVRTQKQYLFKE